MRGHKATLANAAIGSNEPLLMYADGRANMVQARATLCVGQNCAMYTPGDGEWRMSMAADYQNEGV